MKKFKDVEKNRVEYHKDGSQNSVHRSSLLVPEIEDAKTEISFINHFLIKRAYENVACRITGVSELGAKLTSYLFKISEPRVYTYNLSDMFEGKAKSYIVDFFCPDNLYIPFPAVVINHYGDGFFNSVHSYNRVLNDVFEEDSVGKVQVSESSIDVQVDGDTDTFILFNAGHTDCKGIVEFELISANDNKKIEKQVDVKRFTTQKFEVGELFDVGDINNDAVLKVKQPKQHMFYGRLLAGQRKRNNGNFSANHSYYDSSTTSEYWDDARPSSRVYPFFKQLTNMIRMHPIMSASNLEISIALYDFSGQKISESKIGDMITPSGILLTANINDVAVDNNIDLANISSFEVIAKPLSGNTPTRVNHQLVYQENDSLYSSINISLVNPNVFMPAHKKGVAWGQIIDNGEICSYIGFTGDTASGEDDELSIEFYDENGKLGETSYELKPGASVILNTRDDIDQITFGKKDYGKNIWYFAKAKRPDITAIVVSKNIETGNCTGEHSF